MILIVSSQAGEADVFAALCTRHNWTSHACRTVSAFLRAATELTPRVVVTRQRLADGYSDDIINYLGQSAGDQRPRVVVLASADYPPKEEARQVSLGADQVFRDPVRVEVLFELLQRYQRLPRVAADSDRAPNKGYKFAGALVLPRELRLTRGKRNVTTTPKVIELTRTLHRAAGRVVPYTELYDDLFGRRFTGDTANSRVLLAKAAADFRRIGVDLRAHIEVIPKSGYRYVAAR